MSSNQASLSNDNNNNWWDVWSTRILVTLGVIILFEVWQRRKKDNSADVRRASGAAPSHSSDATGISNGGGTIVTAIDPSPRHSRQSRLLDELEEKQKVSSQSCEAEPAADEPETFTEANEESSSDNYRTAQPKQNNERRRQVHEQKKRTFKNATKSKATDKKNTSSSTTMSTATTTTANVPPMMKATTNKHPGMSAFCYWCDVECSLFRIYTLGRNDDVEVVPPYVPHSYRGNVEIALHVTNQTDTVLKVYWVDYKGKHVQKGTIRPNTVWTQTTWIDHPWVFEGEIEAGNHPDTQQPVPYLYYIPYRVIPTTDEAPTVADDNNTGLHKFAIQQQPHPDSPYLCAIQDEIMPFPAETAFDHSSLPAITWTLQHMTRMMVQSSNNNSYYYLVDTLQKYLTNIVEHPEQVKYRQIRIASPKFAPIWQSPMRGLLLAIGFEEQGAYAELGCANDPLSRERIQEVALLSYLVNNWKESQEEETSTAKQPEGADGYGRAGFGRAGNMSVE